MTDLWICPKAGECDKHCKDLNGKVDRNADHSTPHEHNPICNSIGDCAKCIPYVRKYIGGEDMTEKTEMKYRATDKEISIPNLYQEGSGSCFLDHLTSLMRHVHPHDMNMVVRLNFITVIEWAEQDPARIKWLLEKGYIEEVESELDKWERGCPYHGPIKDPVLKMAQYVEWAKRMPRQGE